MKKRIISIIMSLAMVIAFMPAMAFADDGGTAVPISFSDCKTIGTGTVFEEEGPIYYTTVESGTTTIELTDLAGKMGEWGEISSVHSDPGSVKKTNVVDITQGFSITFDAFKEAQGSGLDQDAIADLDFSNIYAMFIMDDDDNYYWLVVQVNEPPKTYGYKISLNGEQLTEIEKSEGVYSYIDFNNVTQTADLFTVTVPKGTESVDFEIENPVLAYNYDAQGNYLDGWTADYMTGNASFTAKIDSNNDGVIDFVQVQTPYDSAYNSTLLYAFTFKYKEDDVSPLPAPPTDSTPKVEKGKTYKVKGASYKVTKVGAAVTFKKAANKKSVSVPKTVKLKDGKTYKVTAVGAKAFTGKKIRTVAIGANVNKLAKGAFSKSKAKTMILQTKKLKKKTVKGSLKGSKINTIKVKVGSKKLNKKYKKAYKKIFTKKNAGKKVKYFK